MEIRNPLLPLNPAGDLRADQRRAPAGAGGFIDLVGESGGDEFRIVREAPAAASGTTDYAELLRQARLQRVPPTQGRDLPPEGGTGHSARALSAYRETVRMAVTQSGGGELVGIDQYA